MAQTGWEECASDALGPASDAEAGTLLWGQKVKGVVTVLTMYEVTLANDTLQPSAIKKRSEGSVRTQCGLCDRL